MKDPHQNIFYYYRGPSQRREASLYDIQVEDNTTKSLINILEVCHEIGFDGLLDAFIKEIKAPKRSVTTFKLQKGLGKSRPDAVIEFLDYTIHIESKVKACLNLIQIRRHLKDIGQHDILVVISNNRDDDNLLKQINDSRIKFLQWSDLHKICSRTIHMVKNGKENTAVTQLIKQFIDYLEVIVMTDFCGFKDADFDFWIDPNPYYVPILRKKLEALANIIKEKVPKVISSEYSFIKPGNISRKIKDDRFAWVAIKRPKSNRDIFNQCNFTIEVSKSSLDINAVIRNGRTFQNRTPIGVFYSKLTRHPEGFLSIIRNIKIAARIVISKRLPKVGERIMPGNERWQQFFDMKLRDITSKSDIDYICRILEKADAKPAAPGVHMRYSIDRGAKILAEPEQLETEIIQAITVFKPILKYLEDK